MSAMWLCKNYEAAVPHLPEAAQQRAPHSAPTLVTCSPWDRFRVLRMLRRRPDRHWKAPRTQAREEITKLGGSELSSNSLHQVCLVGQEDLDQTMS